jgi:hypothetical protein
MIAQDKKTTLELLKGAERAYNIAESHGEKRKGLILLNAFQELHEKANPEYLYAIQKMKRMPVTIQEFMESPEFMKDQIEVWPNVQKAIYETVPDLLVGEGPVNEYIMGGASSTSKSVRAMMVNAYWLYFINCFEWPQELFKLTKPTEIVFMFMSIKPSTAEKVLYKPFYQYFMNMPYTRKWVNYNKDIKSEIQLEQNVTVRSGSANVNSLIAHAIISAIIDEINFFAYVEKSKQTPDGSTFDQADIVHRTTLNRRKSRFVSHGIMPGTICISAQTKYKNDFTDRRIAQALENHEKGVVVCKKKRYEIWPEDKFSKETFKILVGTDEYPTRIIDDENYTLPKNALIEEVPQTFYDDFKRDPEFALREIVGIATNAITPFFAQRHKVFEATAAWTERGFKPWSTQSNYKLNEHGRLNEKGMPRIIEENLPTDGKARYVHVDLSKSHDKCGISITHIDSYQQVGKETLPYYVVDWSLTLEPDSINQVDLSEVRRWVMDLRNKYKINVVKVSYDGYQSLESMQMLRKAGMLNQLISVDKTTEPYMVLRDAIYTNRIALPDNDNLRLELVSLEFNANANAGKGKVDHTAYSEKDASDSVCGSVYSSSQSGQNRLLISPYDGLSARPSTPSRPSSNRADLIRI